MTLTEEQLESAAKWWLDGHHTHTIAKHLHIEEYELATAHNMLRITSRARMMMAETIPFFTQFASGFTSWYHDGIGRG